MRLASEPVSLIPLGRNVMERAGTNAFTYARYLVPYLCDWQGKAIFADGCDMLPRVDLCELVGLLPLGSPLAVVQHDYNTRHPRKYVGTELESQNVDYPRKNQSSLMVWDCAHYAHRKLTPEHVNKAEGLHQFSWLDPESITALPKEWNWLCDEYGPSHKAKLLHWTAGIPAFAHYRQAPHAEEWRSALKEAQRGLQLAPETYDDTLEHSDR